MAVSFRALDTKKEKVQVFLSAPTPAAGVSSTFDMLCKQYPPQKSLQMILRKALGAYEAAIDSGAFQKLPMSYELGTSDERDQLVQTSRMMPKAIVATARAHFDPLGMESTRAFGRMLGTAALAMYFSREPRR